jgi:hypothetical protein
MTWLLWRQHRSQAAVAAAVLALFGIAVLITGVQMAHDYNNALRNCPSNGACQLVGQLFRGDGAIVDTVHLSIAVPILLGVFLGATLVARETEQATNVLVWTQSVTRRHWLFAKVGMALAATVVWSALVSVLVTWWSRTPNALYGNRFEGTQFDTQSLVPVAFALFAVGLGIAAGCLLRRVVPALATTVGLFVAARLVVAIYLRPHYSQGVTASFSPGRDAPIGSGSWTLSQHLVDATGHTVYGPLGIPVTCRASIDRTSLQACLSRIGYHSVVSYHPASDYWRFQLIESGIFVAAAAALLAFAVIHTLRRDA